MDKLGQPWTKCAKARANAAKPRELPAPFSLSPSLSPSLLTDRHTHAHTHPSCFITCAAKSLHITRMSAYADFQHRGRNGGKRERGREGGMARSRSGANIAAAARVRTWFKAHLPLVTSARWRWLLCVCLQVDSSRFYPTSPSRIFLRF